MGTSSTDLEPQFDVQRLLVLGAIAWLVGLFLPWMVEQPSELRWYWRTRWAVDVAGDAYEGLVAQWSWRAPPLEWWWSVPLVHGLALPGLWCSISRGDPGGRVRVGWIWQLALIAAGVSIVLGAPPVGANVRAADYGFTDTTVWVPSYGFVSCAVGALLIGLAPVVGLQRAHSRLARWRHRPAREQAGQPLERRVLGRLPRALQTAIREAWSLRADLLPRARLDAQQSRMLADVIGQLHALDATSTAELRERGVEISVVLERLAPREPRRESGFDELLRVDAALASVVGAGRVEGRGLPYR